MIKISVMYPNESGGRFDVDYYLNKHMPLSIERLSTGRGFKGVSVERGLEGGGSGTAPTYIAMCHYLFDTMDDFLAIFYAHAADLNADVPNFTDIDPVIQVSEVVISR